MANTDTTQAVGQVQAVNGEVYAKGPDGQMRPLSAGDEVYAGEIIVTGEGGNINIDFYQGGPLQVAEQQIVMIDAQVFSSEHDMTAGAVEPLSLTTAETVLASADDLEALLEQDPTAAGEADAGGSNFFRVMKIVEATGSNSYEFGENPSEGGAQLSGDAIDVPTGPVAVDDSLSVNEDSILTITPAHLFGADGTGADNDYSIGAQNFETITVHSLPDSGTLALAGNAVSEGQVIPVSELAQGQLKFTPPADWSGDTGFQYSVNDGAEDSNVAMVNIHVNEVNDAPIATPETPESLDNSTQGNGDALRTPEDTTLTIEPDVLLANDHDPEGDPLTIVSVQDPVNGEVALVDGQIEFTPDPDYYGDASFTYTIDDGRGGQDTATVTIDVTPVNDAPNAQDDDTSNTTGSNTTDPNDDVLSTPEDEALDINPAELLANDSDVDGDPLTIKSVQDPVNGTVDYDGDTITFTPDPDFNGKATFTYTVDDGNGGEDTATVTVDVTPVNDGPDANDDAAETNEDTPLVLDPQELLANDTDIDGDTLSIKSVQDPEHGTVSLRPDGKVEFTPDPDYNGPASFTYTVDDGNGGEDTATVSVNVKPVNDNPDAKDDKPGDNGDPNSTNPNDDALTTPEDSVLTIDPQVLLANDTDVDGDTLTITSVQDPENGTVQLQPDGTITFTPDPDYNGPATFTYTVDDGNGGVDSATVHVDVTPVADVPDAVDDLARTDEDQPLTLPKSQLLANDSDPDGDVLEIVSVQNPEHGTVEMVGDNVVFTPDPDYNGPASFSYTVDDGTGRTDTATVNVTVDPVNDAPNANPDPEPEDPNDPNSTNPNDDALTTPEDTGLIIDPAVLLANDEDIDGDTLEITSVQDPVNGSVELVDGKVVFTPDPDFNGDATFTYTVDDGNGGTDTATVRVTVTPVNDDPDAKDDVVTTNEDTAIDIDVADLLANDTDVDGDTLTVVSVQDPQHGTVALVDGKVTFTPDENYDGDDASFTYTVDDGNGGADTATVQVNINPVNDTPEPEDDNGTGAADDALTTPEDTELVIDPAVLLANDIDPDGDVLTIKSVQDPVNGSVALVDGEVVFNPDPDFYGDGSFTYTVDDGNGGEATATVNVVVTSVNDNPEPVNDTGASDDALVTDEDVALTIQPDTLLANDSDPEGDALTIKSVQDPTHGSVEMVGGEILFTPDPDFNGDASFTYTVDDGNGGEASATVTVVVNPVNDAPDARDDELGAQEDVVRIIDPQELLANDFDVDGDELTIVSVQDPVNGTVELGSDGKVVFTPDPDFNGEASFTYTVSDPEGLTDTATVTLNFDEVNDGPDAVDDNATTPEDTAIDFDVAELLANDTDVDGDTLTVVSVQDPVNGTVALVDGKVTFTPNPDYNGEASFTYTVDDGNGGTDTATVHIDVTPENDNPEPVNDTGVSDDALVTDEDVALTIQPETLLANDVDPDGDALTIKSVQDPTHGSVEMVGGEILFTPDPDFNGDASFTYTVDDGNGGEATATVTVVVNPVNDAPDAVDDNATTPEDTAIDFDVAELLANDTDVDGDTLSVVSVQDPVNGSVTLVDGKVTFTPNPDYNGEASFTYTVDDGNGGTDTATVHIDVTPENDNPEPVNDTGASDDALVTDEDVALTIQPETLLANDVDPDGDALTIKSVQDPTHGSVAMVGGEIVFTPDANYNGDASFTYTVDDGNGGEATATVTVVVNPVNDAPDAVNDNLGTPEDTVLEIDPETLLANDFDIDGDDLEIVSVQDPVNGTVDLVDGKVLFTPDENFVGDATFTYTITDPEGLTDTATVTVNVGDTNDAPDAVDDNATTPEDTAIDFDVAELLANDTDVDGDTLTVVSVQDPVNGSVTLVDGKVTFTPNPDYNGEASFTYTITDGNGGTDTATVHIDVTPENDNPEPVNDTGASDDALVTDEDVALTIQPETLLANDVDPDGDTLTIKSVQDPTHGSVEMVGGEILFTPDPDFNGDASFTYTVDDGNGGEATATVTVVVNPVNDAPDAVDDNATTPEDTAIDFDVAELLANDTDVDGDTLSVVSVQDPVNGAVALVDGKVTFTPNPDYNGEASFTYTITDGNGGTDTATVHIDVTPENDNPEPVNDTGASDDALVTDEDVALTIQPETLLANDVDPDGDTLTIKSVQDPTHGSVEMVGGEILFTPDPDFNGDASFTYTVDDGNGGEATATVTVVVNPVNDAPDAVNDNLGTPEDTVLEIDPETLLANDFDIDGDDLEIVSVQDPVNGTVDLVDGKVLFTPDENFVGDATFTYTITDPEGLTDTATVTVNVGDTNDAPDAVDDNATTPEDTAIDFDVAELLANDTDVDGDTLSVVSVQDPVNGSVALVDGKVTFTPNPDYNGEASFTYTITDGNGGSDTATVHIDVTPVNDPPEPGNDTGASDDALVTDEDVALTIQPEILLANDVDPDGDTLTIKSVQDPTHGSVEMVGGEILFTPDPDFNGDASFTYTVDDGNGGEATATVTVVVNPINDAPIAVDDSLSVDEDGSKEISAVDLFGAKPYVSQDGDDYDIDSSNFSHITITNTGVNGVVLVDGQQVAAGTEVSVADIESGKLVFKPDANFNSDNGETASFKYTVSDGALDSNEATVNFNVGVVNDPPQAEDDAKTTPEDTPLTIAPSELLLNDSDPDGDPLEIISVQNPVNGSVAMVGGEIIFTPSADYNGDASFTYTISDGKGGTDTATVNIDVTPVNDAPVAVNDTISDAVEDTAYILGADQLFGDKPYVSNDGNDYDIDSANFTHITISHTGTNGEVQLNGTAVAVGDQISMADIEGGKLSFMPDQDHTGSANFKYTVSDGALDSNVATVTFSGFENVNDAPVAIDDTITDAVEDTAYVLGADQLFGDKPYVSNDGNDYDIDSSNFTHITITDTGTNGEVRFNGQAVDVGDQISIADIEGGKLSFMPDQDHTGSANFKYTVSDGALDSNVATVTFSGFENVNDAPVAVDDTLSGTEDTTYSVTASELFGDKPYVSNDGDDYDIDSANFTHITITDTGTNGKVQLDGADVTTGTEITVADIEAGKLTFVPNENFNGEANFKYTVSDGLLDSNVATVTLNIAAVNDAPLAVDDANSISEDTASISSNASTNVLANDLDVDSSSLSVTAIRTGTEEGAGSSGTLGQKLVGSYGTLSLKADGSYSYELDNTNSKVNALNEGDTLQDVFTYTMTDGALSDKAELVITIDGTTDADKLLVGSVGDDVAGSTQVYTVDDGSGPGAITGEGGNDVLIGDPGGTTLLPGSSANIALMLDISESMKETTEFFVNSGESASLSRIEGLKSAVSDALNSLAESGAADVMVNLGVFETSARGLGSYHIISNSVVDTGELDRAISDIKALQPVGQTNYEAGLQETLSWLDGNGEQKPLDNADLNKVIFISDGEPNKMLLADSTNQGDNDWASGAADMVDSALGQMHGIFIISDLEIEFEIEQSAGVSNGGFNSITISSLPDAAEGALMLNGQAVQVGDVISHAQMQSREFWLEPGAAYNGDASFNFVANYGGAIGNVNASFTQSLAADEVDTRSEVQAIKDHGYDIEAVGINIGSYQLGSLSLVEGLDGSQADNINNAQDLSEVIGTLISGQTTQTEVGDDNLQGGEGNDLIFGDSVNTDKLADLFSLGTAEGAGWLVFQQLEQNSSIEWTREDTMNYIKNQQAELAQESGRDGGHDVINAGAGDDVVYGQEGNDVISGGAGDDMLSGGLGVDTFVWELADVPEGTSADTVSDFDNDETLDFKDLVDQGAELVIENNDTDNVTVKASYKDAQGGSHVQEVSIEFDANANSHHLLNDGGIIKIG